MQNSVISIRITSLYGSQPSYEVFAFKTATLGPELLVSMSPSPHLWFLHAQPRLLDQNYKSLWAQTLPMAFCMQNSVISTRITSLHWSLTSPVVLRMQNNAISIRITSLYGSQTSPMVFGMQNNAFSIRIT